MQNININLSQILIVSSINNILDSLMQILPKHNTRIIRNEITDKDEFLLAQATAAIKESYIATSDKKYIILCGSTFRKEAQNSLLKVLEEPPKNIIFIIVTTSKSTLLPTILSRMPHKFLKEKKQIEELSLNLKNIDLKDTYNFLKENQKISKTEAKTLIESMIYKINTQKIKLTTKELDSFSVAIKLIELNSKPINILTTLLLTLIHRKNRY
ncbi:DNA polymerase III subunit delta' [Arcobacter sp. 31_11_sub10_T18]|nr:DNA polymerase III subunit delta' [Arcobacter sp. 31_11_sub10_T18]